MRKFVWIRLAVAACWIGLVAAGASSSSCATRGLSTKQTLTLDVLQPSHDALANLQDLELETFSNRTLPALTPEVHRKIEGLLATAFADHAKATRAVRAWRAGDPVPATVTDLAKDAHDVLEVVKSTLPSTARILTLAQTVVDEVAKVVASLTGK